METTTMRRVDTTGAPVLVGTMEGTFVYDTIKDRWPKIVTKIVDHFHQNLRTLTNKYGQECGSDVASVLAELSELRYRMTTDKPLEDLGDTYEDVSDWNRKLAEFREKMGDDNVSWFRAPWLFVECYLYRLIFSYVYKTKTLKQYDFFADQKEEAFITHANQIKEIFYYTFTCSNDLELTPEHVKETATRLMKMSLWGNRGDLSLTGGEAVHHDTNPVYLAIKMGEFMLVDDIEEAIEKCLMTKRDKGEKRRVDIVLDNAGLELMGDLLVAEFLGKAKLADKVVLHCKAIPWFVSDVTESDIRFSLENMQPIDQTGKAFAQKWKLRMKAGELVIAADKFWTSWHSFEKLATAAPALHEDMAKSNLIIFKGDLNYRKLVGDRAWPYTTPIKEAVGGLRLPPVLALRTLKCETVAGLRKEKAAEIREKHPNSDREWMCTGDYAIGQYVEKTM